MTLVAGVTDTIICMLHESLGLETVQTGPAFSCSFIPTALGLATIFHLAMLQEPVRFQILIEVYKTEYLMRVR